MAGCVLIVDDCKVELNAFAKAFERRGIKAVTTSNPDDAVPMAMGFKPDFIILDLYLGDKSGFEVCKQLKLERRTRDIPVMLVTGSSDINDAIQSMHIGCIDFIPKPVGIDALIDAVIRHKTVQVIKEAYQPLKNCLSNFADKYGKDDRNE